MTGLTLWFGYRLPEGRKPAEKPTVRKAKVAKLVCLFVDLDGNGVFNEKGVDGWALTGMNYLLPLEDVVVMELYRVAWSVDEKGEQVDSFKLDEALVDIFKLKQKYGF